MLARDTPGVLRWPVQTSLGGYSVLLRHSVLYDALFPEELDSAQNSGNAEDFALRRLVRYAVTPNTVLNDVPLILFDTETTGLDSQLDRIIEFGAMKVVDGKVVDQFESFVSTDIELTPQITSITGITNAMLKGAPDISEIVPKFLRFIRGGIIVAHNADFDLSFLKAAATRLGYELEWPCFCTVKLARKVVPGLPKYNLDTIAEHFHLTFEARHRAVGDVKVLKDVLIEILSDDEYGIETWADVAEAVVD